MFVIGISAVQWLVVVAFWLVTGSRSDRFIVKARKVIHLEETARPECPCLYAHASIKSASLLRLSNLLVDLILVPLQLKLVNRLSLFPDLH